MLSFAVLFYCLSVCLFVFCYICVLEPKIFSVADILHCYFVSQKLKHLETIALDVAVLFEKKAAETRLSIFYSCCT